MSRLCPYDIPVMEEEVAMRHACVHVFCCITVIAAALSAQADNWADCRDAGWLPALSDNATNYIGTAEELAQFAWLVNQGIAFSNTTTIVTNTIDLSARHWMPAGTNSDATARFHGAFFASPGARIDGLTIDAPELEYAGLFGCIGAGGHIASLIITNASVNAAAYAGMVVGLNQGGAVTACVAHGEVNGAEFVGGIAGYNSFDAITTGCTVMGRLNSGANIGGIAAYNHGTIAGCTNYASVTIPVATGGNTGGIVGLNTVTVKDCVNNGPVSGAGGYCGGIVGMNTDVNHSTVVAGCINHGDVSSSGGHYVGGIVGMLAGSMVTACENHGAVNSANSHAGGIAGIASSGTALDCVNHGTVSGGATFTGGIVGYGGGTTIIGCENRGAVCGTNFVGGVAGYAAGVIAADCVNFGDTTGLGENIGGIAGIAGGVTLFGCENFGVITGGTNVAGIAGQATGGAAFNCENHGEVSGDASAGGVVGLNLAGAYENCVNRGGVSGGTNVAGIAGLNTSGGRVANCVNYAADTGAGIAGGNTSGGSVVNCYWRAGTLPAVGDGAAEHCASFAEAPGTLAAAVEVPGSGTTTADLLTALNAWAHAATPPDSASYLHWSIITSPDGYPRLSTLPPMLLTIETGGSTADVAPALPAIILPLGGSCHSLTGVVTDHDGDLVYSPGQAGAAAITAIAVDGGAVTLTFSTPAPVALFGKSSLGDTAWTYLSKSDGVHFAPMSAILSSTSPLPYYFFAARKEQ